MSEKSSRASWYSDSVRTSSRNRLASDSLNSCNLATVIDGGAMSVTFGILSVSLLAQERPISPQKSRTNGRTESG